MYKTILSTKKPNLPIFPDITDICSIYTLKLFKVTVYCIGLLVHTWTTSIQSCIYFN